MGPGRGASEMICWRIKLMKKFLLGTVALIALGATAPALAADMAARPYTKAPAYSAPIYNWTRFFIRAPPRGGGRRRVRGRQQPERQRRPFPRRRAGRLRLSVRPHLGLRCRSPVQLAWQQQH